MWTRWCGRYIECQERTNAVDRNARTRYVVSESPKNAVTRYSTKGDAVYVVYRISWGTPSSRQVIRFRTRSVVVLSGVCSIATLLRTQVQCARTRILLRLEANKNAHDDIHAGVLCWSCLCHLPEYLRPVSLGLMQPPWARGGCISSVIFGRVVHTKA